MENSVAIGAKLRKLRGNKSKAEVALAIGVSESAYTKYERGERSPKDSVKIKIADYYKKSVGSIFFAPVSPKVDTK